MEHETLEPDLVHRPKVRPVAPEPEAADSDRDLAEVGPAIAAPATALRSTAVIGLQRTAGNAAVTALLREKMATSEDEEDEASSSPVLDVVGKGGGEPLNEELLEEMESRFGDDFSDVRVHTDAEAADSAAAVSARAYTVGSEIVLGADAPDLDSAQGKQTLAHELTHVVQQRHGPVAGTPTGDGVSISDPSDRFEQAAERNATDVMSGPGPAPAPAQRAVTDEEEGEIEAEPEPVESEMVEPEIPEEAAGEEEEAVQGLWLQRDEDEDVEENAEVMEEETEADEAAAEAEDMEAEMETEQEETEAESETEESEAEEEEE